MPPSAGCKLLVSALLKPVTEPTARSTPAFAVAFLRALGKAADRDAMRVLLENQYPRDSEEKLLRAFRTLDPDNKGYVEAEKIRTMLTTHGERFSQEEIDDFLQFAVDAETGHLHYEDYVTQVAM